MALRGSLEKKEEKERVRKSLMRATLQLAAAHGFAGLGLREVARESGIAPTSFYRHFADMEELGTALIGELAGPVLRGLAERVSAAPRDQVASALVDAALAALASDPELLRFAIAERTGAYASLRGLLYAQQAELARALEAACSSPPWAADAAACVLLDVCARALDQPAARWPTLRAPAIAAIRQL